MAGYIHSLAVTNDGSVYAWGQNYFGEVGDGTEIRRTSPTWVSTLPFCQASLQVSVTGQSSLTVSSGAYSPSTFQVTATVTNPGTSTATAPEVGLFVPMGFTVTSPDTSTHHLADLAGGGSAQTTWTVTSPAPDTIAPGGPYQFIASVTAGNMLSPTSGSYAISIPPISAPSAPTNIQVGAGNGTATVSWTPPATGHPLSGYVVSSVGSQPTVSVQVSGSATSATLSGLTQDCSLGRYQFSVQAQNSLGSATATSSTTAITAGHPSDPPASVAILVQGIGSTLPSDPQHAGYNPLSYSYCGLSDARQGLISGYDLPSTVTTLATSFDPTGPAYSFFANPNLTDELAGNGAVVLPFSYRGTHLLGDPGDTPAMFVTDYASTEPAHTLKDTAANLLDQEVLDVHRIWPSTRIVIIGHSNGGLVSETFFENHTSTVTSANVGKVWSVDGPINGVNDPGILANSVFNAAGGGAGRLSPQLLAEYHQLWNNRQSRDASLLQLDSQMNNVFSPIGTNNDQLYNAADSTTLTFQHSLDSTAVWHGIDSQVLCTSFTMGQDCAAQTPPDVLAAGAAPVGNVLNNNIPSHTWVFTVQQYVDMMAKSVLPPPHAPTPAAAIATPSVSLPPIPTVPTTSLPPVPTTVVSDAAVSPGSTVTIRGSGLGTSAGRINFASNSGGRVDGTVTSWSDTQVVVTVPATAATGQVYAYTAAGAQSYAGGLTILQPANGVQSLTMQQTSAGTDGTAVTATVSAVNGLGQSMANVPITLSTGVGESQPVLTNSNGQAVFTLTDFGATNLVAYSGTTFVQQSVNWASPAPLAVAVTASPGPHIVGDVVTIQATVTGPNGTPAPNQTVTFSVSGPSTATLSATSGTTDTNGNVTTTVTNTSATSASVMAALSDGSASGNASVSWAPKVSSLTGTLGPLAGGTHVTIHGTGFVAPVDVYFGQAAASGVTVIDGNTVSATAPAGQAGVVDVTVKTVGGTSATSSGDLFTYEAVPAVQRVAPTSGPVAGGTSVTIWGTGFTADVTVSFGGRASSNVVVNSSTSVTAVAPAGTAGTVDIQVSNAAGTSAVGGWDQYTYQ